MFETPIPLFTSLPPRITRRNKHGEDIGEHYAASCFQSWQDSGFQPVTLNAASEDLSALSMPAAIDRRTLARDAGAVYGKPLPYFGDIIAEMKKHGDGVVALTNADIMLRLDAEDRRILRSLRPGQCIVSNRMDIDTPENRTGEIYFHGFDFFALHTADLPDRLSDDLVFGMPWWDHFLPLWLYLSGLERVQISMDAVLHLRHDERWDSANWTAIGQRFLNILSSHLETRPVATDRCAAYFAQVQDIPNFFRLHALRVALRNLTRRGRVRNRKKKLQRLSRVNEKHLAEWDMRHSETYTHDGAE